jgi:large subunit ribosomal protein L4
MQATVKTLDAGDAGTIELKEAIFGLEPRKDILHRMVRYQQLKAMAGTHHSKDRSQVKVTGRKFGRQKGGGTARHGNKAAPQFRGGGKAFGPKPRSHAIDLPKKVRALALRQATSAEGKTKNLKSQFAKLELANALIIDGAAPEEAFVKAARNIPNIDVLPIQGINVVDILRRRKLVLTKAAIEALEERFADAKVKAPAEAGE